MGVAEELRRRFVSPCGASAGTGMDADVYLAAATKLVNGLEEPGRGLSFLVGRLCILEGALAFVSPCNAGV